MPLLNIRVMLAFFQSSNVVFWHSDAWKISVSVGQISGSNSFRHLVSMLSGPVALRVKAMEKHLKTSLICHELVHIRAWLSTGGAVVAAELVIQNFVDR